MTKGSYTENAGHVKGATACLRLENRLFDRKLPSFYTVVMDSSLLDIFTDAAKEVFKEIGFDALDFTETNGKGAGSEIIANVGITGDLQGYLMIQADLPSACNFVSKMLSNMEVEPEEEGFSQFHKEAIGEIVNQVSGRSVMNLSGREIDCNITPPTILTGSSMAYNVSNLDHARWSDITGSFGTLSLFVGVKKIR